MRGAELIEIGGGAGDAQHARRVDAVATRVATGSDAMGLTRHLVAIQQCDDAGQWPHPARRGGGLAGGTPAHRFGPSEIANDLRDDFSEDFGCGAAFAAQQGEQHDALGRLTLFQLVAGQAGLFQEAFDGLRGGRGGGAFDFLRTAFAGSGNIVRNQPQPARGGVCRNGAVREASSLQGINEPRVQLLRGSRLHARRDFFGLELKEELHLPCSTQQSATAFTRSRTRPI